jgi:hypothetical protein
LRSDVQNFNRAIAATLSPILRTLDHSY